MNISEAYMADFDQFKKDFILEYKKETGYGHTYYDLYVKNMQKKKKQLRLGYALRYIHYQDSAICGTLGIKLRQYRGVLFMHGAFMPSRGCQYLLTTEDCEKAIEYLYRIAYSRYKELHHKNCTTKTRGENI